jgi:hypothetical protein
MHGIIFQQMHSFNQYVDIDNENYHSYRLHIGGTF